MGAVQKAKSEETRRRVLEAAICLMGEEGLSALQIRPVAAKAGYSVGSVYKHFPDLDTLIIAVNGVTLNEIKDRMIEAVEKESKPLERLQILARSYLHFALERPNFWRGLFDHHISGQVGIPMEHKEQNIVLLSLISKEISLLHPDLGCDLLAARSRTCFAAVHGLVAFSMEGRFVGLSGDLLEKELNYLVERLVIPG